MGFTKITALYKASIYEIDLRTSRKNIHKIQRRHCNKKRGRDRLCIVKTDTPGSVTHRWEDKHNYITEALAKEEGV